MTSSHRERLAATLRLTVVASVLAALALRPQPAVAKGTSSSRAHAKEVSRGRLAQQRLHHGIAEYESGRYAAAIAELRAAVNLAAPPLAYFYLGRCYERLDDKNVAVTEYASFVANAPKSMRPLRDVAVQRLVALRASPGKVDVSSTPTGAQIHVDGRGGFPPTPATLELTPGKHTIRVSAANRVTEEREVDVSFDSKTSLEYDLKDAPQTTPAPLAATPAARRTDVLPPRPTLHAVRVASAPKIDGILDDAVWRTAPAGTAFTQKAPYGGQTPTESTLVRVVYGDDALYVAFDCEQVHNPVVALLARRDRPMETDAVTVALDSRSEGRSAFEFTVTAAGTLVDGIRFDDGKISREWDAVWEAKTAIRPHGWSAELRIPLRALRFESAPDAAWRLQARRYVSARQETDEWAYIPLDVGGEVSHYGVLEGLNHIESDHSLELRPFVLGKVRYQEADPAIVNHGWDFTPSAGLDFKWHPVDNLALDGTINPDFGQVEADQLLLNLTTVEVAFPEKRPFFLAGMDDFSTTTPIFYSRRIGRTPPAPPVATSMQFRERLYDYPQATPIYGALKLAGDLSGGTTIAALSALTGANQVDVVLPSGAHDPRMIDPLTSFNVLRLRTEVTRGFDVGATATATLRGEPGPHWPRWLTSNGNYPQALDSSGAELGQVRCPHGELVVPGQRCFHDAYVGSIDTVWRSPSGEYAIRAQGYGSAMSHGPVRVQPDGTPIGSGDLGVGGALRLSKQGGEHWVFDGTASAASRRVDFNDLGFMDRQNDLRAGVYAEYRTLRPWLALLETHTSALAYGENNLDGLALGRGVILMENVVLKSRWALTLGGYAAATRFDDREVGDGTALERASLLGALEGVSTDPRAPFVVMAQATQERLENGANWTAQLGLIWHPLPAAELQILPTYSDNSGEPRYAGTGAGPTDLVFGRLHAQSAGATLRASWTFLPTLTLQSYAQLFLAMGHYSPFGHFTLPPNGEHAVVRLSDLTPGPPPLLNPDFQRGSLAVNVVLAWEYHLGSTLYLLYVRSQNPNIPLEPGQSPRLDPAFVRSAPATDLVMVKVAYWLG